MYIFTLRGMVVYPLILLLFSGLKIDTAVAQENVPVSKDPEITAGMIRASLVYGGEEMPPASSTRSRSIPLAFGLSAVVPGLGQAYNGHWIKAVVGIALEAAFVAGYINQRDRGLEGEDAYKAYAHQYWNPILYAQWLEDYSDWLPTVDRKEINIPENIDFAHPENWTAADRSLIRSFFNEIRTVEDVVYHPETGASFSHKIPYFGEQQYYELIGKYFQFAPGWEDYPSWKEGEEFSDAIDPEKTGSENSKPNIQGRFLEYAREHAHTNDLLRRASRISALIVVNHILSAVDAAVFAKLHNDRVSAHMELGLDPTGNVTPAATLRVRL